MATDPTPAHGVSKDVVVYDTTLRDGAQTEGISLSVEDRVKIAQRLDELGIDYIEGGWPSRENPTDIAFFRHMREMPLAHAKLVAFGSTRRPKAKVEEDPQINSLLNAGTSAVTIFGKSWDLHVVGTLGATLQQNLEMIEDTVRHLKSRGLEVIFDAEHFFDGYQGNADYALATLQAAAAADDDCIVLCDTNGGTLPHELEPMFRAAQAAVETPLGIHAHNDSDVAVANTLLAVHLGATHVHGTINGYGERCGNANLCSVVPNLQLKLGKSALAPDKLARLYEVAHYISEVANMPPAERQPFVGRSAFAHKGGVHVDAVLKRPETYEHVTPEVVGNQRRLLVSDQAGTSTVVYKARALEIDLDKQSPETRAILQRVKEMEHEGYQFEGAEASFDLLMRKTMGIYRNLFDLGGFRVITEKRAEGDILCEATIKVTVDGVEEHTAAEGDGPVHALDGALRKALEKFYPDLKEIKLTDFKVRVIAGSEGTAAKVRVLVESSDDADSWSTVGVHTNIIEASWQALVDSIEYGLMRRGEGAGTGVGGNRSA
ncbi:MAG: citramalate synthase [Armatimonadota bacterium]|nr:MAG: citramalate synthase [Armatimonadota bacterium]